MDGDMDPVLGHLLRNVRPAAVKSEFLQNLSDTYTANHEITLVVRQSALTFIVLLPLTALIVDNVSESILLYQSDSMTASVAGGHI